ncbi:2-C-methyl-D-erythritol 4-phosphate cytidylyltransferase [Acinetobacter sp. ANC 4558]|nr:2-C-methyl-D-erythritol 4-phosphate cytidylyltransferase [Acinetobacter sp. ANC 4558]
MNFHQNNKIWAIIPAAGSGSRFSKTELKQYQLIQNKTVLQHTVERINQLDLAGCVLAVSEQDDFVKTLSFEHATKIHFCLGGRERVNSVLNALIYLSQIASQEDWVLVHDAARPCVDVASLEKLITSAISNNQNAILATPVRDTLKKEKVHAVIEKTVDRHLMWQAQTPQVSRIGILKHAIEEALAANINITDEASALEFIDEAVMLVQGRADNIKITYPEDLVLAKLILESQKESLLY